MSDMCISKDLADTFFLVANESVARLSAQVRAQHPQVSLSTDQTDKGDYKMSALSSLWFASDEAVELTLVLRRIEGTTWCEATLFIGTNTVVCLETCLWHTGTPDPEQVAQAVRDFVALVTPRFMAAVLGRKHH